MSVDELQKLLDKRFPKGVHVRVTLGDGDNNFLVPRIFVTGENSLWFSPQLDMEIYFEPDVANLEVTKSYITVTNSKGRTFTFTPLTGVAADQMADRVKDAMRPERLEMLRDAKASEVG